MINKENLQHLFYDVISSRFNTNWVKFFHIDLFWILRTTWSTDILIFYMLKLNFFQPSQKLIPILGKSRQLHHDMTCLGLMFYWDTCQLELRPYGYNQDRLNYWLTLFKSEWKAYRILYPYPEKMWSCFGLKFHSFCG